MVAGQESLYIGTTEVTSEHQKTKQKMHVKFHAMIHHEEHKYKVSMKSRF